MDNDKVTASERIAAQNAAFNEESRKKAQVRERYRIAVIGAMLAALCSSLITIVGVYGGVFEFLAKMFPLDMFNAFIVLLGICVSLVAMLLYSIFAYKTNRTGAADTVSSVERDFSARLQTLRRDIQNKLDSEYTSTLEEKVRELSTRVSEDIREKIVREAGNDLAYFVGQTIAESSVEFSWRARIRQDVVDRFNISRDQVGDIASESRGTASKFRWIGVALAFFGLFVAAAKPFAYAIGWLELPSYFKFDDFLPHAMLTMPVILLSEALALIMFRYQSQALNQLRYFTNESTTLNLRCAAAILIVEQGMKEEVLAFAKELSRQERNIVLRNGDSVIGSLPDLGDQGVVEKIRSSVDSVVPMTKPRNRRAKKSGDESVA